MHLEEICLLLALLFLFSFLWICKKAEKVQDNPYLLQKGSTVENGIRFILAFMSKWLLSKMSQDKWEHFQKIYPGKGKEEIYYVCYGKYLRRFLGIVLAGLLLAAVSGFAAPAQNLLQGYLLERDEETGQEKTVEVSVKAGKKEKTVSVKVPAKKYGKAEREKRFQDAINYIDRNYLGENTDAKKITKPLNLMTMIPDSALKIIWSSSAADVIDSSGALVMKDGKEEIPVELIATISYGKEQRKISKTVCVAPVSKSREQLFWERWQWQLEKNNELSATSKYLYLPDSVQKQKVSYREEIMCYGAIVLVVTLFILLLLPFYEENKMQKELQNREKQLRMDYPEFIERFVLLVEAGLNIKGVWLRMVQEYERREEKQKKRYLYEEMLLTVREMENGMGEPKAYELFGKRIGLLPYMKFSTLIVQNLKKGNADLVHLLDFEVADAFHERRENAKVLGEEAGTKLLFPMMLMLSIVFALILFAAFRNM